jgi:uncharacterized RDD family membrane protein YckC
MSVLRSAQTQLAAHWPKPFSGSASAAAQPLTRAAGKPALWRRGLAEMIDRLLPLPLVAWFFPPWAVLVFVYHLFCDAGPERRSVGKWVCRLRAVDCDSGVKAALWQAVARRCGSALSQTAWCCWAWLPWAAGFELAALLCVLLSPAGQRPEDWLAGTRVVTERVFRQGQAAQRQTGR